jgi:hypothetical protein
VADAVLKAIRDDKAELTVAPLFARFGGRLGLVAPSLFLRLGANRTAEIPQGAVDQQRTKR